jgi:hypothetical protein
MKIRPTLALVSTVLAMRGADIPPLSAPSAVGEVFAAARKTVEHDGQVFELANSTSRNNAATDEYIVAGEKITDWTQLITVQRLTLAKPTRTDEFLAYFRKQMQTEDGSSLEILKQAEAASVFAVRFPKSDRNDEQVMICLAFTDGGNAAVLNIVQYALKPTRVSVDLAEMRIRSWRDKFLAQAGELTKPRS